MSHYHFTYKSGNAKTGPIPVTMTSADSCPPSCPLNGKGCYAQSGPLSWAWRKYVKLTLTQLCERIRALPAGTLWRHNQAGDLPGSGEQIDGAALRAITQANLGKRGFTYTHKMPKGRNAKAIAHAVQAGFAVNLSADSLSEADEFATLGIAPVVVTVSSGTAAVSYTPAGRKIVVCPAQQRDGVTCATCKLCSRADRTCIVGFRAHGSGARRIDARLTGQ